MPYFKKVAERLKAAGQQVLAIYTDNCCSDRLRMEEAFKDVLKSSAPTIVSAPPLREYVTAAEVVDDVVEVKGTVSADMVVREIRCSGTVALAFNCRWISGAVLREEGRGCGAGPVVLLQLGYTHQGQRKIAVFHLPEISKSRSRRLPASLTMLLNSTDHRLYGCDVKEQLKKVARDYAVHLHGALSSCQDLPRLAYDAQLVDSRGSSLSEIFQSAHGKEVPQYDSRVDWSSKPGPSVTIATTAVGASMMCYAKVTRSLSKIASRSPSIGDRVLVLDPRRKRVAVGMVVPAPEQDFDLGDDDLVVRLDTALMPRANAIQLHDDFRCSTHQVLDITRQAGLAVVSVSCVVSTTEEIANRLSTRLSDIPATTQPSVSSSAPVAMPHIGVDSDTDVIDMGLAAEGDVNFKVSRVKLDLFHCDKRITDTLSKSHGAFGEFCAELRDSLLYVSPEEVESVKQGLCNQGWSRDRVDKYYREQKKSFLRRCIRVILPPARLEPVLEATFAAYRDRRDSKTGQPLFNEKTEAAVANMLKHVRKGCLSDGEDVDLYFLVGRDGHATLRCVRGTSALEGYHKALRRLLGCGHRSPETMHWAVTEFNRRWNLNAMARSRGLPPPFQYELEDMLQIASLSQRFGHDRWAELPPGLEDMIAREAFGIRAIRQEEAARDQNDWSASSDSSQGDKETDGARGPLHCTALQHSHNFGGQWQSLIFVPSAPHAVEVKLFGTLIAKHNVGDKTNYNSLTSDWMARASPNSTRPGDNDNIRPATIHLLRQYGDLVKSRNRAILTSEPHRKQTQDLRRQRQRTQASGSIKHIDHSSVPYLRETILEVHPLYPMRSSATLSKLTPDVNPTGLGAPSYFQGRKSDRAPRMCKTCGHLVAHPDLVQSRYHVGSGYQFRCTTPSLFRCIYFKPGKRHMAGNNGACIPCTTHGGQRIAHKWSVSQSTQSPHVPAAVSTPTISRRWVRDCGVTAAPTTRDASTTAPCARPGNSTTTFLTPTPIVMSSDDDVVQLVVPNPSYYRHDSTGWQPACLDDAIVTPGIMRKMTDDLVLLEFCTGTNKEFTSVFLQRQSDHCINYKPSGLANPNTMCYLNAAVKLLLSTPEVACSLIQGGPASGCGPVLQALRDIMDIQACVGISQSSILPLLSAIESVSGWSHVGATDGFALHDANLCLETILSSLLPATEADRATAADASGPTTIAPSWAGFTSIHLTQVINCASPRCMDASALRIIDPFLSIKPAKPMSNLQDALSGYFDTSATPDYRCEACQRRGYCSATMSIAEAPRTLWLQTGLLQLSEFPDTVTLQLVPNQSKNATCDVGAALYDLHGIVIHRGAHYVAVTKDPLTGAWHLHDDGTVSVLRDGPSKFVRTQVTQHHAVVTAVLYSRQGQRPNWTPGLLPATTPADINRETVVRTGTIKGQPDIRVRLVTSNTQPHAASMIQ